MQKDACTSHPQHRFEAEDLREQSVQYIRIYVCTFSEIFDRVANESSCICVYNSLQWVSMYFVYMYAFRQL